MKDLDLNPSEEISDNFPFVLKMVFFKFTCSIFWAPESKPFIVVECRRKTVMGSAISHNFYILSFSLSLFPRLGLISCKKNFTVQKLICEKQIGLVNRVGK